MKLHTAKVTALVAYPLSQAYIDKLEHLIQAPLTLLYLPRLKALGIKGMLTALRQIKGTLLIPYEDPSSAALLPIFHLVSMLTRAKQIILVDSQLTLQLTSRWCGLRAVLQLGMATLANIIAILRLRWASRNRESHPAKRVTMTASGEILFINANLWFGIKAGGSVGHIAGVCNALAQRGYQVTYAAVAMNPGLISQVQYLPLEPLKFYGLPYEANLYRFNYHIQRQLYPWLKRHPVQLIYQRLSLGNLSGITLAQNLQLPIVIEYNGSETWIAEHWGSGLKLPQLARDVEVACLHQADYVVTISKVLEQELCAAAIPKARIITYPNGIDPSIFDPGGYSGATCQALREQLNIPATAIVGLFMGTFGIWHGVTVLANALATLAHQDPAWFADHQFYMVFVGDGLQLPFVKQILLASQAHPYCRFVGLVPQLQAPAYLALADIVFSPHQTDPQQRFFGSPTKLFEYMAMGKAILASDLEQIGDVLQPAIRVAELSANAFSEPKHAVLSTPGNSQEIIQGIVWLVDNPAWRLRLGQAARQKVLTHYTWAHHVDYILKTLVAV